MGLNKGNKIFEVLIGISAITSIVFLLIVESFNNISLDDIGFALRLQKVNVWNFMMELYFTWQGRFMGFLLYGILMKSYFLFHSMLPSSILLYVLNITLLARALMNFYKLGAYYSVLNAIILHQLYIYSMFDLSSYFWMCTKGYTLMMSLSLFAFSDLLYNKRIAWDNYVILFISFAFLGCSYEIFAPIILLFMGCLLLFKLQQSKYNVTILLSENKKLVFSFAICLLFFSLMIIAPGNWIRMNVYAKDTNFVFSDYIFVVFKNCLQLIKLLFFRMHYFLAAGILLLVISQQVNISSKQKIINTFFLKRILFYALVSVGSCFVSILLNTFAIGDRMEMRAFNHINLFCFLFLGFSIYELATYNLCKKIAAYALPLCLVFVIVCNTYTTLKAVPELRAYQESVNHRMDQLELLRTNGNKETIKLKHLDVAEFYSIDDLWKLVVPKFSSRVLLKPNEVSNNVDNYFNKTYREYYKLDFDVITDLSYEL